VGDSKPISTARAQVAFVSPPGLSGNHVLMTLRGRCRAHRPGCCGATRSRQASSSPANSKTASPPASSKRHPGIAWINRARSPSTTLNPNTAEPDRMTNRIDCPPASASRRTDRTLTLCSFVATDRVSTCTPGSVPQLRAVSRSSSLASLRPFAPPTLNRPTSLATFATAERPMRQPRSQHQRLLDRPIVDVSAARQVGPKAQGPRNPGG
jgi:hypothetical protein